MNIGLDSDSFQYQFQGDLYVFYNIETNDLFPVCGFLFNKSHSRDMGTYYYLRTNGTKLYIN